MDGALVHSRGGSRSLTDVIRDEADDAEARRRMSRAGLEAMRDAGVFRLCVPRSLDGQEAKPLDVLETIEQLAGLDGAAGWAAMIAATTGCLAGHLPGDSAAEIYGSKDALIAGPFAPLGVATSGKAEFVLSGRWPFASLCEDATWLTVGTTVDGGPARRLLFVPTRAVTIHDTWSTLGMRATGSHDVEVSEEVVPVAHSVSMAFDEPVESGALYRFPVLGLLASGIASVMLGIARAAIDDLVALAGQKTPTYSVRRLADRSATQIAISNADTRLNACRALLREQTTHAWAQALAGPVELGVKLSLRVAAAHAVAEGAQLVSAMYGLGGGTSVYLNSSMQRRLRDAHTATQHAMTSSAIHEIAGRHRLGLRIDATQI